MPPELSNDDLPLNMGDGSSIIIENLDSGERKVVSPFFSETNNNNKKKVKKADVTSEKEQSSADFYYCKMLEIQVEQSKLKSTLLKLKIENELLKQRHLKKTLAENIQISGSSSESDQEYRV